MSYKADKNVQKGLNLLLKYQMNPIFAMRDFMITPRMLHDVFKVHAERFNYASSSRQFEIANASASIFRSSGYALDGVTGYQLYSCGKVWHSKLQREEYLVPIMYDAAKKYEALIGDFEEVRTVQADETRHGDTMMSLLEE